VFDGNATYEYAGETFVPLTGDVGEKVGEVGLYLCEAPPLGLP
jgi:hypothetical protein